VRVIPAFALGVVSAVAVLATRDAQGIAPGPNNVTPIQLTDSTRFVAHNEHMIAGLVAPRDTTALRNPFEGNADAIAMGAKLYISYNCVDCHGGDGSGAMAPAFVDGRWHFGGSAAEVYESIYQGRPEGMPAWGGLLDKNSIWRLVSYVRSLDKGKDVATENFTGKTVERTGH
jgi:cytochrome c oxidase cbb3-type subunit 3